MNEMPISIWQTHAKSGQNDSPPTTITWVTVHCDPAADVVLISCDLVYFRVSGHYLKRSSGFVRDLLSVPFRKRKRSLFGPERANSLPDTREDLGDAPVIELQARSATVRAYISLVYLNATAKIPKQFESILDRYLTCFDQVVEMIDIYRLMQSDDEKWDKKLKAKLYREVPNAPWQAFCYAAHLGDLTMARAAIRCFGRDPSCPPSRLPDVAHQAFADAPADSWWDVIRLRARASTGMTDYWHESRTMDWTEVAELFGPAEVRLQASSSLS
ncbi:hypothetical protein BD324DRAFT_130390 [Kockovaella imperatae]|uniref:BTB domain-containing protein n=1 Tax=Kockovaella imperatae TaxID=4999 RepID=A0A1Y1UB13_9TREE|nr:hypothetical protein BD324DRAFT_130390 [Kockovaella imperatae]ORX34734.1 hypothetical protein BD324DRAFT_130390 [Kockovaella imperatae]